MQISYFFTQCTKITFTPILIVNKKLDFFPKLIHFPNSINCIYSKIWQKRTSIINVPEKVDTKNQRSIYYNYKSMSYLSFDFLSWFEKISWGKSLQSWIGNLHWRPVKTRTINSLQRNFDDKYILSSCLIVWLRYMFVYKKIKIIFVSYPDCLNYYGSIISLAFQLRN